MFLSNYKLEMKLEIYLNFWDNETLICNNAYLLNK